MAEEKSTPCDALAKECNKDSVTHKLAAIGTDFIMDGPNLPAFLTQFKTANKVYPEFFAWWLRFGAEEPVAYSPAKNEEWITSVIAAKIPVVVAHVHAAKWVKGAQGKTKKPDSMGTWDEVVMLTTAGYKWAAGDPPTLVPPKVLLSAAKAVEEDLVDTLANLKVSAENAEDTEKASDEDAEKVSGKDVEEEGSDKK